MNSMNQEELDMYLNTLDAEERDLMLAADDALDALNGYRLSKQYGVSVICNPGGDRTKISIDGVIMNQEQFAAWLMGKQMEEVAAEFAEYAASGAADDELPDEVEISYEDLCERYALDPDGALDEKYVLKYLRDEYNHYLSGTADAPSISYEDDVIVVTNISWGRKR